MGAAGQVSRQFPNESKNGAARVERSRPRGVAACEVSPACSTDCGGRCVTRRQGYLQGTAADRRIEDNPALTRVTTALESKQPASGFVHYSDRGSPINDGRLHGLAEGAKPRHQPEWQSAPIGECGWESWMRSPRSHEVSASHSPVWPRRWDSIVQFVDQGL